MYQLNYFNFKERENNYLLTNDLGEYIFIEKEEFQKLITKKELPSKIFDQLLKKKFVYTSSDEIFSLETSIKLRRFKSERLVPTNLHIFVVSKNCNFNCIYCQAGNLSQEKEYLMNEETAKAAVDIALQSPTDHLSFEFQGGEPLTNYKTIKYIIEYAESKKEHKKIEYNIVSNLTLLTDEMIDFFVKHKVSVSTSLDGNRQIQLKNRPYTLGNSYDDTISNMERLKKENIPVGAIQTTTKYSLEKYKEMIDTYIKHGLNTIYLRPLTKLGKAGRNWDKIGYTAEEFLTFYKNAFNYIINLNKQGIDIAEGHSLIFLKKILCNLSINYMELRSPCGGGIGQLAYYYDGNIYTCDEGRMLAEMGDQSFCLGNVFESNYTDLMDHECTKTMCISSCLEILPYCHSCVYSPYCGTCPVLNLAIDQSIFAKDPHEFRCKIYGGMLDILFDYLEHDKEAVNIFKKWINYEENQYEIS